MEDYSYRALYRTNAWRTTSRLVLLEAGFRCEVTPGCPRRATTADHIVSAWILAETGRLEDFFAMDNLRAACRSCNSRRGAVERNARYRGVPRGRRVGTYEAALRAGEEWAARERAFWASRELEAPRRAPNPQIR